MVIKTIRDILSSDIKPVIEANILMKAVIESVKHYEKNDTKKVNNVLKIYDFYSNSFRCFDIKNSKDIDFFLKLAYFNEWQKKIKFDSKWVDLIENRFLKMFITLRIQNSLSFFQRISNVIVIKQK